MRYNPRTRQYEDAVGNAAPDPAEGQEKPYDGGNAEGGAAGGTPAGGTVAQPPSDPPADATGGANPPREELPAGGGGDGGGGQEKQGGWSYQGTGFQAPARGEATPYNRAAYQVPPPPEPPAPPPPSIDFMSLVNMPAPTRGAGYTSATDFMGIANSIGGPVAGPTYQTAEGAWRGEEMLPDVEGYAREWMASPNRYTTPWMQTAQASIDAQRNRAKEQGTAEIEDYFASRGLTGGNYEEAGVKDLIGRLDENRLASLSDLLEQMASVEAGDRAAAGGYGLDVGEFGRGLGTDRREEGQFAHGAAVEQGRNLESDTRYRTDTKMGAADRTEDAARYGYETDYRAGRDYQDDLEDLAGLRLEAGRAGEDSAIARGNLGLDTYRAKDQGTIARAGLGLDSQKLDLDAYRIQQDARLRGEEIDLDTARARAEDERDRNTLAQDESQFGRSQTQQNEQFGKVQGLAEKEAGNAREHARMLELVAIAELIENITKSGGTVSPELLGRLGVSQTSSRNYNANGLPTVGRPDETAKGKDGKSYQWVEGKGWVPITA